MIHQPQPSLTACMHSQRLQGTQPRFHAAKFSMPLAVSTLFLFALSLSTVSMSAHANLRTSSAANFATVSIGNVKVNYGNNARYRSVNRYDHNYERYRRDCAEYVRSYGSGKTCHFPQANYVTVIQNNQYGARYDKQRYGYANNHSPVIVVNVNRTQQPSQRRNGFRVIHNSSSEQLPQGWNRDLRRGDILDAGLYDRGLVTHRSPRGVVRIKIGDTTIQLKESNREIISVINR